MFRSRAVTGWLLFLIMLHTIVAFADFIAPYDPTDQDRERPYISPMPLHLRDASRHLYATPFAYALQLREGSFNEYQADSSLRIPLRFFVRGSSYRVFGVFRCSRHLFGFGGQHVYLLGSDGYGRDVLSRILVGAQTSLLAGLLATALALLLGTVMGITAGYFGGWTDDILMRAAELCLALPWLYLLFALRAFLPLSVSPKTAFFLVVMVIGTLGWARPARLIRGVALSAKERDFVQAARGFGASNLYLLRRHVFPQVRGTLLTQATILIPQYVLAEATLSFLGLGVPEPAPSWGNLLAALQQYSVLVSYWWMYLPAAVMVPFFIGYMGLSSSIADRVGPQPR